MDLGEWVNTIGVPAVVVILILREVFAFVKEKKGSSSSALVNASWRDLKNEIRDHGCNLGRQTLVDDRLARLEESADETRRAATELHKMHAHYDEDGVPVWHFRKSMRKNLDEMVELLRELVRIAKDKND